MYRKSKIQLPPLISRRTQPPPSSTSRPRSPIQLPPISRHASDTDSSNEKMNADELIHLVSAGNFVELQKKLANNSTLVNATDISGRSLLTIAAEKQDLDSVEILLENRANQLIKDDSGRFPLDYAIKNKDFDIIRLLLNQFTVEESKKINLNLKRKEITKLEKNPDLIKLLQYPYRPIPDRLKKKELIGFALHVERALNFPEDILELLKIEYGFETLRRFNNFLLTACALNHFFPYEVKFLVAGSYGAAFSLCITKVCDPPLVMKLVPFLPYGQYGQLPIDDARRPENVEWTILKKINDTFERLKFPHVTLAYVSFFCENKETSPLSHFIGRFVNEVAERIYKNVYFRITFMEFAEGGSLLSFIQQGNNRRYLKQIIFQVLLIMATLLEEMPGFRHNDLHMGNLLIRERRDHIFAKFRGKKYVIRSPKVMVLINDFDFAFDRSANIDNAKYNAYYPHNLNPSPYSDMFKFFNHLLSTINLADSKVVYKFARYVIPCKKLIGHNKKMADNFYVVNFYGLNVDEKDFPKYLKELDCEQFSLTDRYPDQLLNHPIFEEFIY
jgi:hypothetical protein